MSNAFPEGATTPLAGLDRFVAAQREIYPQVVRELADGHKQSHWIWFIFPQLAALGRSETARFFGLSGLDEARAYLHHALLAQRLRECTGLMIGWAGRRSAEAILGSLDAMKFRSSMTLFETAAGEGLFTRAIDLLCDGSRDEKTLRLLVP